ncbi:uncharacterized protein TNCV_2211931 [Trichonephila clavipes]|nr:uncharacterized protein TNCV_2211931 [Trichonephila clavipes]
MDEQLKALMEGINALKNGQEETKQEMQKSQEETKERMEKGQQEMQKSLDDMRRSQEETKNELKERMEKEPVLASPVPVTAFTGPVKLSTYDGKTSWEVYKTQFSIISEANGWTEEAKACQLAASLRGEAAEVLQTLPDTERLNLNSLYNALDLRFGQKYSKDYAQTRLQNTGESLQEYASEVEDLANLAFSEHPATVREVISLQYFVDGLKEGEIQKAVRMADVQDLKSALLYALKLEAATQASRKDRHSIRGARLIGDEPCESRLIKEMEKLKEEMQKP